MGYCLGQNKLATKKAEARFSLFEERVQRLERDIVVHVAEAAACGRLLRRCARGTAATAAEVAGGRIAHALTAAEQLHVLRDDLGRVTILAGFLVLPFTGADAALDIDRRTFLQILTGDFRQATEEGYAVPLRRLLHFAALPVLPAVRRGDPDIGDGVAAGHVARLRIGPEIVDQNHLVY